MILLRDHEVIGNNICMSISISICRDVAFEATMPLVIRGRGLDTTTIIHEFVNPS